MKILSKLKKSGGGGPEEPEEGRSGIFLNILLGIVCIIGYVMVALKSPDNWLLYVAFLAAGWIGARAGVNIVLCCIIGFIFALFFGTSLLVMDSIVVVARNFGTEITSYWVAGIVGVTLLLLLFAAWEFLLYVLFSPVLAKRAGQITAFVATAGIAMTIVGSAFFVYDEISDSTTRGIAISVPKGVASSVFLSSNLVNEGISFASQYRAEQTAGRTSAPQQPTAVTEQRPTPQPALVETAAVQPTAQPTTVESAISSDYDTSWMEELEEE